MLVLMLLRLLNNYHCTKLKKRSNPRENRFPIMHFQRECRYTQPPFSRNRAIPPLPAWQPNSSPLPFLTFPTSHPTSAGRAIFSVLFNIQFSIFPGAVRERGLVPSIMDTTLKRRRVAVVFLWCWDSPRCTIILQVTQSCPCPTCLTTRQLCEIEYTSWLSWEKMHGERWIRTC